MLSLLISITRFIILRIFFASVLASSDSLGSFSKLTFEGLKTRYPIFCLESRRVFFFEEMLFSREKQMLVGSMPVYESLFSLISSEYWLSIWNF